MIMKRMKSEHNKNLLNNKIIKLLKYEKTVFLTLKQFIHFIFKIFK